MSWAMRRPTDVTDQLIEYADTGRLVAVDRDRRGLGRRQVIFFALGVAALGGIGGAMIVSAATGSGSPIVVAVAALTLVVFIGFVVIAANALHDRFARRDRVDIDAGAVLPPELIEVGNWIKRGSAWMRIEEVGRDGGGRITALLSTGEVVHLTHPVTIAGGAFRPARDPVADLRR